MWVGLGIVALYIDGLHLFRLRIGRGLLGFLGCSVDCPSDALDTSSADLRLLSGMLCKVASWRSDALLGCSRHCFNRIALRAAINAVFLFSIADPSALNCPMSDVPVLGFRPTECRTGRQEPRPCMIEGITSSTPCFTPLSLQHRHTLYRASLSGVSR